PRSPPPCASSRPARASSAARPARCACRATSRRRPTPRRCASAATASGAIAWTGSMAEPIAPGAVRYTVPPARAAMPPGGHHVVEASAGTGKTYLIERRVVDLMVRGGVPLEHILLVTFTEKATAELRRRVRALVRELVHLREDRAAPDEPHWRIDGEARAGLRAALHGFDQAAIHTIHGFCHRVLLDSAFDGRRPLRQSQVATEVALREALSDCMRDTLATDPVHGELLAA